MRKIKKGDMLLLDFGGAYKGYLGDMTRTIFLGKPTERQKEVYNLVLKAQQEVQDNITNFVETEKSAINLNVSNNAAIQATDISIIRYREGESDFTPVLDSERQQLAVQRSLTSAKGDIPKAVVALYRSLGGGWQIRGCNDIVSNQVKLEMAKRINWGNLLKQENHQPPRTQKKQIEELYLPNW